MYQAVSNVLEKYDAELGAAEAHGLAVGMLCIGLNVNVVNWLDELFPDGLVLTEEDRSLLENLFERTRELLDPETEEFVFDLFMPDDGEALRARAEAIRCWGQGFLFGVGYQGKQERAAQWPGDCEEVMRDIIEFTKIDSDVEGEEDEAALMEIQEYLRAAALIVRDQFADQSNQALH